MATVHAQPVMPLDLLKRYTSIPAAVRLTACGDSYRCVPVPCNWVITLYPPRRERAHEVFTLRTSCYAWDNEPVTATIYSGVALLLKVGAGICVVTNGM